MDTGLVLEPQPQPQQQQPASVGSMVVGAAFHCRAGRSVLRDSRVEHGGGPVPVFTRGPVFYQCRMDGGGGGGEEKEKKEKKKKEEVKGERTSPRGSGRISHCVEKTGLGDHRDAGSSGVLKRASPTHCPAVNGVQSPVGFVHLDIRNPGKQAEPTNNNNNNFRAAQQGRIAPPTERQPLPSSHIPVPRNRNPSGHADKEVMAATVLTSLSTSPLVLNPPSTVPEPASRAWKEVLSASYSSSTSGNWSWDASDQSVPSTPSPPLSNDASKNFLLSSRGDDVIEDVAESPHFMFEDPIPRKRKNSMKVMFKCLWKNCEQVLSTSSGIQRHVRTAHLGRSGDSSDYSDGEEDFYYTEIEVNMDSLTEGLSSLTPTSPTTCCPPPVFPSPLAAAAAAAPHSQHINVSGAQCSPSPTLLSQSAPSMLYHIHTDHAYQSS
ncbi:zinc finger protein 704 isoform X2 [Cyclopterus lumpus]|uniref:zinc finger protein 704 isoform X2 n=1 Tax=Cyclopterus lumpus TaxID=8103 RepID=UPI0014862809|nr:zinc finger protein 704 isoform X2 [Cyclopterus lumpus]